MRFRENSIVLIGDIKKMYHTVKIKTIEQHTHRFLWRYMDTTRYPDTYVIQRVSFGDKPSGTTATVALRKTAEMGQNNYPQAAQMIKENTYMNDVIESVSCEVVARRLTRDTENLLKEGSFKMKEWISNVSECELFSVSSYLIGVLNKNYIAFFEVSLSGVPFGAELAGLESNPWSTFSRNN